jgi:phosphohistidine phosphatase
MREFPDYYYIQSAVIPYRRRRGKLEALLITSRKKRRWIIPKGIVEPTMSAADSAAKEAWEEAGVAGMVHPKPLGVYSYEKWGDRCTVTVYALAVKTEFSHWPEDYRDREWVSVKEAAKRVREKELKAIIRSLPKWLKRHG